LSPSTGASTKTFTVSPSFGARDRNSAIMNQHQKDPVCAITPPRSPPPTFTNPFDDHGESSRGLSTFSFPEDCLDGPPEVSSSDKATSRTRRLHLSRIPDFPDLLHPNLRRVVSYPLMSFAFSHDAELQIDTARSSSSRQLKRSLPSDVLVRNATAALPGSLLWEAMHDPS
jgi:hypothetical protein